MQQDNAIQYYDNSATGFSSSVTRSEVTMYNSVCSLNFMQVLNFKVPNSVPVAVTDITLIIGVCILSRVYQQQQQQMKQAT
jgi:hypothetical protein